MKFDSSVPNRNYPHTNYLYTPTNDSFLVEITPIDRKHYRADAEVADLGPLKIARIHSNSAVVTRNRNTASPGDRETRRFSLLYAVQGEALISHHLGTTSLRAGEFSLMDNHHARTLSVHRQVSLLIISVTADYLHGFIPCPEEIVGQKLSASTTDSRQPFDTVLSLWEQIKDGSLEAFAPALAQSLLRKVSRAYSSSCLAGNARNTRRRAQLMELIEENLGDPELSVESLARRMGVSSRYLRALVSGEEKLSHYILRRRLEQCGQQLVTALHRNVSITDVAFQWGFNSPAHFSRVFKRHYGMTPRQYRRVHLGGPVAPAPRHSKT